MPVAKKPVPNKPVRSKAPADAKRIGRVAKSTADKPARPPHSEHAISNRDLNRATLARQMLLARAPVPVASALHRLVGMQAQIPGPPYVGLWSRLARFERDDLAAAIESHAVVRATFLRGTLHVTTAGDYIQLRPVLQEMLTRSCLSTLRDRAAALNVELLVGEAREFLSAGPRTFTEIRDHLAKRHKKLDERAMGYAVRMHLPLVQVPGRGSWGFSNDPPFSLADAWLGHPLAAATDPRELVLRYLAGFGPATARDMQTWSGLQGIAATIESLRPRLLALESEDGRELFDLPDAPRPGPDVPAPTRFLPEYDNLVLGHADRTRIVPEAYKPKIYLSALRVRATVLVDGFVACAWKIERGKKNATLVIEQFATLTPNERQGIQAEGEKLLAFSEPTAVAREIRFVEP